MLEDDENSAVQAAFVTSRKSRSCRGGQWLSNKPEGNANVADFFQTLQRNAERFPASLALVSRAGNMNYQFLNDNIEAVAANARKLDIGESRTVIVDCSDPDARLLTAFGLMRAGVTVSVGQSAGLLAEQGYTIDAAVTDNPKPQADFKIYPLSAQWFTRSGDAPRLPANPNYSIISSSSGSTGKRKIIKFSRKNIEYRIKSKYNEPYFQSVTRVYSTIGNTTCATLADLMIVLEKCGTIIQSADRTASTVLETIDLYQPNYVTMAPAMLVRILHLLKERPRRMNKIGFLRLTGAYCSAGTRRQALRELAHQIVTSYGATEIARVAAGTFTEIADTEGSVGPVLDGMEIETVNDQGNVLGTGEEGEIRVKAPRAAVATYIEAGREKSPLRNGYFYPGDIGRVDRSGQLIITGRKSLVINFGGNKVSPEVVEALLVEMDAIEDVGVAGLRHGSGIDIICAAIVKRSDIDLKQINRHLLEQKANITVSKLKLIESVPRTDTGKIDRERLAELVAS